MHFFFLSPYRNSTFFLYLGCVWWGGGLNGAMVLGKLAVPGRRPTNLDKSRAMGTGGGCFDFFSLIYHFSFLSLSLSFSLWETARCRLKYCLKGPLNPKQPINQLGDGSI